jgi:hypothetical protein
LRRAGIRNGNAAVISGTFKVGMGDRFDESKMGEFPAGSFAYLDPDMHHYPMASGEVVVQVHRMSPVQFNYVILTMTQAVRNSRSPRSTRATLSVPFTNSRRRGRLAETVLNVQSSRQFSVGVTSAARFGANVAAPPLKFQLVAAQSSTFESP